jgi:hypothetical protein
MPWSPITALFEILFATLYLLTFERAQLHVRVWGKLRTERVHCARTTATMRTAY